VLFRSPDPDPDPEPPTGGGLVDGLTLTDVAAFQSVKIDLVSGGSVAAPGRAPLVAGKDTRFRVYVTPGAGWSPRQVTAELAVVNGGEPTLYTDTKTISGPSNESDPGSLFEIDVPGSQLRSSTTLSVTLLVDSGGADPASTSSHDARFPRSGGTFDPGAEGNGGVDLVIVPIRYDADGSGRVPDTGASAIQALEDHFLALFPTHEVRVTVHAPVGWSSTVSASGGGWSSLLNAVMNLRASESPGNAPYYLGVFEPASSFSSYCRGGCVAGLAPLNQSNAQSQRAGIALGFPGENHRWSLLHELGHAMGRPHAPCGGASGVDPGFPHSGGNNGVIGFDARTGTLLSSSTKDIMGYCDPQWVSDYTTGHLFDRIVSVTGPGTFAHRPTEPHHLVTLTPFHRPIWADSMVEEFAADPDGSNVRLALARDVDGRPLGWFAAHEVPLSDGASTNLLFPDVPHAASFELEDGPTLTLPVAAPR